MPGLVEPLLFLNHVPIIVMPCRGANSIINKCTQHLSQEKRPAKGFSTIFTYRCFVAILHRAIVPRLGSCMGTHAPIQNGNSNRLCRVCKSTAVWITISLILNAPYSLVGKIFYNDCSNSVTVSGHWCGHKLSWLSPQFLCFLPAHRLSTFWLPPIGCYVPEIPHGLSGEQPNQLNHIWWLTTSSEHLWPDQTPTGEHYTHWSNQVWETLHRQ